MENPRYYEVLGVSQNSSANDIKKAYHRIARQHHPDRAKNGDVEVFKKATLAYETLNDQHKRAEYDALIDRARLEPPKAYWFTKYSASQAAASAAFKASTSTSNPEEKIYRRRPQQTKFSRKSDEFSDTSDPNLPQAFPEETSTRSPGHLQAENFGAFRTNNQSQAQPHPLSRSYSVPRISRKSKRPQEHTPVVDLTEGADPLTTRKKASQRAKKESPSTFSDENLQKPAKRSACSNSNLTEESPKKKLRVFDFSEMKSTPPFTQKHGSSFQFDKINEALHEDLPNSSTFSIPRQHNRQTAQANAEKMKQAEKAYFQGKLLLNQYTAESLPALEELFRMHKTRVQLCETSRVNPQDVLQNFVETEYILEVLLAGTKEFINHMR